MAAAVAAVPEKLARRQTLIEHCWGTMKWLLPGRFLVRGKVKVGAEVSLAHFGHNFKRALAVVGLTKMRAALAGFQPAKRKHVLQAWVIATLTVLAIDHPKIQRLKIACQPQPA